MATRTRILNQDNGFGFGKASMKPRRPLQELSRTNMENLPSLDIVAPKAVAADKPNQEKVKKNGGRRALGDLTNSSKLLQRDLSSRKIRLPSVAEKGAVVPDPARLHDHRECKKAQRYAAMDVGYFLETVGLRKDNVSPSTPSKPETRMMRLEFEGCDGSLSPTASPQLLSPVRHLDRDVGIEWDDDALDFCGFKMESPSKSEHRKSSPLLQC